jgi:hypothetical protein
MEVVKMKKVLLSTALLLGVAFTSLSPIEAFASQVIENHGNVSINRDESTNFASSTYGDSINSIISNNFGIESQVALPTHFPIF